MQSFGSQGLHFVQSAAVIVKDSHIPHNEQLVDVNMVDMPTFHTRTIRYRTFCNG